MAEKVLLGGGGWFNPLHPKRDQKMYERKWGISTLETKYSQPAPGDLLAEEPPQRLPPGLRKALGGAFASVSTRAEFTRNPQSLGKFEQ